MTDAKARLLAEVGVDLRDALELTVEWWPLERVLPYARNPRIAPEAAIAKVAGSLKEFGFRQPIVVDADGVIIAGHTRLLAAQRLGFEKVPVHVASELSAAQVKAYRLVDNRSAQETSWDLELLPLELAELLELEIDLSLTGFDAEELTAMLASSTEGLTDPDEVPEPPAEPVSRPGDLYLLGGHRLLCGDSTKAADVERLMDGKRAGLMATDPPYLVDYDGGTHPSSEANGGIVDGVRIGHDEKHWDAYLDHSSAVDFYRDFLKPALEIALTPDVAVYQCFGMMRTEVIWQAWREVGLLSHQVVIWKKTRAVLTYSWFLWDYEVVMVGWPKGKKPKRTPPADTRAVWEIASTEGNEDGLGNNHPTIKPVELIRRPILWHTTPGGLIYEPFCGSGTALVAAEQTNRHLLRHGALAGLRGRRRDALGAVHWQEGGL